MTNATLFSSIASRRSAIAGAAVLVALLAACSGPQAKAESELPTLNQAHYPTLVMAEPELTFVHTPADVYVRAYQVVEALTAQGIPVIAPWEVDVAEGEPWPHGQAHLSRVLESNGVGDANILVLRLRIEEDGTMRAIRAPGSMGGASETRFAPDVTVSLTVERLSGAEVARVWRSYEEDVFTPAEASDPETRPMLRDALALVSVKLGEEFEAAFPDGPRGGPAPIAGDYNARQIFSYGGGAGEPLEAQWTGLDPVALAVEHHRWFGAFVPGISVEEAGFFDSVAPGVRVTRVSGALADAGVRAGDYVVAVGGQPALGVHVFHRLFLSGQRGRSIPIDVLRGGAVQRVYVTP